MIETIDTARSIDEVGRVLEDTAAEFGLSVLNMHDLAQRMTDKGHPFDTPVRVFDVCSAAHAHEVLSKRLEMAVAMPCRIAVYEQDGRTVLSTLRPSILLALFREKSLEPVAAEIETRIVKLMERAARD
jgi:uncharacterized protein (DUF302 family)